MKTPNQWVEVFTDKKDFKELMIYFINQVRNESFITAYNKAIDDVLKEFDVCDTRLEEHQRNKISKLKKYNYITDRF